MFKQNEKCLLCSDKLKLVKDLGFTPLANELHITPPSDVELFPLRLMVCKNPHCHHLQISCLVSEERMYKNYLYQADTGQSNRDYFRSYAEDLMNIFPNSKKVLDIGSNDGLFLSYFKDRTVLGVDPSRNISEIANSKGIKTVNAFFNEDTAEKIRNTNGLFDLITCNNCFAHNSDLDTIVKGIKRCLTPTGYFVFEVSYGMELLRNNLFDLIYHEHIHHWTLTSAKLFFQKHLMEVVDAIPIKTHGGSIRVIVKNKFAAQEYREKGPIHILLANEKLQFNQLLENFTAKKYTIHQKLQQIHTDGYTISALGYPAKASTLLWHLNINSFIQDVFDDNELKIGHYAHGGQKILPTSEIKNKNPDYLIILSWNYANELMERFKDFKGKFIVPLPKLKIYEYQETI